jgi:hypothetical protein
VAAENLRDLQFLVNQASGQTPTRIVQAIPELEAILFERPALIRSVVPLSDDAEILLRSRPDRPKRLLEQLGMLATVPKLANEIWDRLGKQQYDELRQTALGKEILGNVAELAALESKAPTHSSK